MSNTIASLVLLCNFRNLLFSFIFYVHFSSARDKTIVYIIFFIYFDSPRLYMIDTLATFFLRNKQKSWGSVSWLGAGYKRLDWHSLRARESYVIGCHPVAKVYSRSACPELPFASFVAFIGRLILGVPNLKWPRNVSNGYFGQLWLLRKAIAL